MYVVVVWCLLRSFKKTEIQISSLWVYMHASIHRGGRAPGVRPHTRRRWRARAPLSANPRYCCFFSFFIFINFCNIFLPMINRVKAHFRCGVCIFWSFFVNAVQICKFIVGKVSDLCFLYHYLSSAAQRKSFSWSTEAAASTTSGPSQQGFSQYVQVSLGLKNKNKTKIST